MSNGDFQYRRSNRKWVFAAVTSVVVVVILGFTLRDFSKVSADADEGALTVYCAAGIRKPVEALAKAYTAAYGVPIRLEYGSSGELEGKLQLDADNAKVRADLYVPADAFFANRAATKGLVQESLPVAQFRLVLAVKPDSAHAFTSVDELLKADLNYVICDQEAGVGKKTAKTLGDAFAAVKAGAKATFPRVTEAAAAVQASQDVDAAFIWNTTAAQFDLKVLKLTELDSQPSVISMNVVSGTTQPAAALRFARYVSAKETGSAAFEAEHFEPLSGDAWSESPELTLYCGGVARTALAGTIKEFEKREGVRVNTNFGGCGTLVAAMKSIDAGEKHAEFPDAFMTCDASYMPRVQENFLEASNVSSTKIVMLVRKGNPKGIKGIEDLKTAEIKIGTTDRTQSTLGDLSWQIFADVGIKDQLEKQKNVIVTTPTAHELILQMTSHTKLDVVLVYEANCQKVGDQFELIPVAHPLAKAVQNIAAAKLSKYPLMTGRLLKAVKSVDAKQSFESNGFQWWQPAGEGTP